VTDREVLVVVRIWRTSVVPERAEDYRRFARERSLPMFRRSDGFLGALFTEDGVERIVVTLWADRRSAERLAESAAYLETVAELERSGILAGEQGLEVGATHLTFLDPELVDGESGVS
jgi:heme-degrading monooxygenase HmoA